MAYIVNSGLIKYGIVSFSAGPGFHAEAWREHRRLRGVPLLQAAHVARALRTHRHDSATQVRLLPGNIFKVISYYQLLFSFTCCDVRLFASSNLAS